MMELSVDKMVKRFKDYISFNTQSDEYNDKACPSTPGQMIFAKHLAEELKNIGLREVELENNGYIMATLPANGLSDVPVMGFIAHIDTSFDAPGSNIKPQVVKNYDGKDIILNATGPIVLKTADFPEVIKYQGQDIMFTDGTTLLGADDKAGVTAIVSAAEYLLAHPELKHGKIRLAFTPDEETGRSADKFDVKKFAADFAYTVDGGELGALEYENFNAANPVVEFYGRSVHTGDAKGKMLNAITLAMEWQQMLPAGEKPEYTAGYEGFYHVHNITGNVEKCTLNMLVRDHDKKKFAARKEYLLQMAAFFNKKYGDGVVSIELNDVYSNMLEKIADGNMFVVELAKKAMLKVGVKPEVAPIRGGTDGARLSFMGLPCPNLFTGGANFHGRYEYLPLSSLQKAGETVIAIMTGIDEIKK